MGDITSSRNYRPIAGGCILLKLIDLVIIVLEEDKLSYDTMHGRLAHLVGTENDTEILHGIGWLAHDV